MDVAASGLLHFGFGVEYYRGLFINFTLPSLIVELPLKIPCPPSQHLQIWIPTVRDRYLRRCEEKFQQQRLLSRLHWVLRRSTYPMEEQVGTILDAEDTTRRELYQGAEKLSQKLIIGMVYFSPEFNWLGKHWLFWEMVCKAKHNDHINLRLIKIMSASCGVERPLSCNIYEARTKSGKLVGPTWSQNQRQKSPGRHSYLTTQITSQKSVRRKRIMLFNALLGSSKFTVAGGSSMP